MLNTYWDRNGWKSGEINKEDFELAKSQGYMFDYPKYQNHNDAIRRLQQATVHVNCHDVANAFLFSLSTRKLEYRSALASYYYAKSIPVHEKESDFGMCRICGFYGFKKNPNEYEIRQGVNIFNFERHKWGGVRHDSPEYALFDLEQFQKLPKFNRTDEDVLIFKSVLDLYGELEPTQKIGDYAKLILSKKTMRANKSEISTMLGILAICDVFNSKNHKGYLNGFTKADGSRDPVEYKNDFTYPANMWHAFKGINKNAISQVFGTLIEQ